MLPSKALRGPIAVEPEVIVKRRTYDQAMECQNWITVPVTPKFSENLIFSVGVISFTLIGPENLGELPVVNPTGPNGNRHFNNQCTIATIVYLTFRRAPRRAFNQHGVTSRAQMGEIAR